MAVRVNDARASPRLPPPSSTWRKPWLACASRWRPARSPQHGRLDGVQFHAAAASAPSPAAGIRIAVTPSRSLPGRCHLGRLRPATGELRSRISDAMARAARDLLMRSEGGLPNLAVVSSVAPFVRLFGTVRGIMSRLAAIGQSQNTSLATVAPRSTNQKRPARDSAWANPSPLQKLQQNGGKPAYDEGAVSAALEPARDLVAE